MHKEIRNRMGTTKDTVSRMKELGLKLYELVRSDGWNTRIIQYSPMGRRKKGRSRRDEVDKAMEKRVLRDGHWLNKREWR